MQRLDLHIDGRPVALARMMLAVALAINSFEVYLVLSRVADGALHYPTFDFVPAPSGGAALVLLGVGLSAATYLLVGLGAGVAAGVGTLVGAVSLVWDQQTYSSHLFLTTLLLAFLIFARSDARWSVAARVHGPRDVPWWPQLLMMTQVTVCYAFAALSKINPYFPSGDDLAGWIWVDLPTWVYPTLAVGTIVTELLMSVLLWLPGLRVIGVALGVALHVSIVLGMADLNLVLFSFAMASMSVYWPFLTRPPLALRGQRGAR